MEFWQYPLAFVGAVLIALFVGISIAYLRIRFVRKDDQLPFFKLFYLLFSKNPEKLPSIDKAKQSASEPTTPLKSHDLTEFLTPELVNEFEYNFKSAAQFSGDRMLPLKANVWDSHQESTHKLPAYLRSELERVYDDIKTLNSLVRLSTELDSQSSNLADYRKLLARIAQRTKKIKSVVALGFLNE